MGPIPQKILPGSFLGPAHKPNAESEKTATKGDSAYRSMISQRRPPFQTRIFPAPTRKESILSPPASKTKERTSGFQLPPLPEPPDPGFRLGALGLLQTWRGATKMKKGALSSPRTTTPRRPWGLARPVRWLYGKCSSGVAHFTRFLLHFLSLPLGA